MLVQVGNAGEGISTVLTIGSALVGLLVIDQSSFASIRVVASWTNMLLAASCLPSMLLLVGAPVVAWKATHHQFIQTLESSSSSKWTEGLLLVWKRTFNPLSAAQRTSSASLCSLFTCLFKLLTVASWRLHTGQLVAPVWIFVWFLREPGVVNTLWHTKLLSKGKKEEG